MVNYFLKDIYIYIYRIIRYTPLLPYLIINTKNPTVFLSGYFNDKPRVIKFRNGLQVKTYNRDDISSVSVIFIKGEYGKNFNNKKALTIIDIGANKGYFSILAGQNRKNKIISYEPIHSTFTQLQENIDLNKLNNIKAYNLGVAGKNEIQEFFFSENKSIVSSSVFKTGDRKEKIQCISLEELFHSNTILYIDILKMDCEGSEFEILYKAHKNTLSKIKTIRMEYHNNNKVKTSNIDSLTHYLQENNFTCTKKEESTKDLGIAWFQNQNYSF